ncbi:MAG: hypothetical protein MUF86_05390 [Akkermansiaceae bacterium]|nr:hypothetical protein [Akkermansiaceae bacterium]
MGEVALAACGLGKGGGEIGAALAHLAAECFHDRRREHVHAEEAEVISRAQAGDDEFLLGLGGGGFFDDGFHFVKALRALHAPAADRAVMRQFALVGGLHGGNRALARLRGGEELGGARLVRAADVEVVADRQQKRIATGESGGAVHGMTIAARLGLRNEMHPPCERTGGFGVGGLVAGTDDHRDFGNSGGGDFTGKDRQGGLGGAVTVHQRLKRQRVLVFSGGGDDGFGDSHARDHGECRGPWQYRERVIRALPRPRRWLIACGHARILLQKRFSFLRKRRSVGLGRRARHSALRLLGGHHPRPLPPA